MSQTAQTGRTGADATRAVVRAGVVLGLGFGGFFDGIVFHQLLQWHHMVSAHPDPQVASDLELNVVVDGLFHVVTYLLTIVGVGLVWRAWRRAAVRPPGRALVGAILAGWGLFNVVEGLTNHFLLEIHHVWPDGPGSVLLWDLLFLAWGVAFVAIGWLIVRGAARAGAERPPEDAGAEREDAGDPRRDGDDPR